MIHNFDEFTYINHCAYGVIKVLEEEHKRKMLEKLRRGIDRLEEDIAVFKSLKAALEVEYKQICKECDLEDGDSLEIREW